MNKVYVITGGTGGMGKAIARRFGHQGHLLLVDVNEERLNQTISELAIEGITSVTTRKVDITDEQQVNELATITGELGELGAIIHTAGLSPTMGDPRRILEVNSIGTALILKAFLPLATQETVAVCIASNGGHMIPRNEAYNSILTHPLEPEFLHQMGQIAHNSESAYAFSKLGVLLMVENQAWDWGQKGARIVSLSPGTINTPMGRQEASKQEAMKVLLANTPLGREGEADEIASAVQFLCSSSASYITGTDLLVDGGTTAGMRRLAQLKQ
ncbi:NAD(P)-dependent dehydrogenase (short-subunit alcohol dehydrogenase family) [Paenibacillus shirakamiensis]|uniref:NAD(P)-dependent dehydrogenase (Short-subunit alcohol dehydrogenase family) n=1 Tax=Paenibacillus shirakamiensis TaxID=1265935 RepID=A0ABS4JGS7_9BACL|nr:SDR family oxidoreductase [Paenibacillus shirakamiensis]MBP2000908.1 NAD(P)-dependent dehydrogenase (short-subunit alcohol dehydrogenase family) [Paenibacillus shirakamiensis]